MSSAVPDHANPRELLYAALVEGAKPYLDPGGDVAITGCVVDLEVGRVRYISSGDGEPVVLVHGFGSNSLEWLPQLADLGRSRRVIALDLPGHGGSTQEAQMTPATLVDAVEQLCTALGIERAIFGGHSLGGGVVLALARRRPDLVRALVLVGAAGFSSNVLTRSYPDLAGLLPMRPGACLKMLRDGAPGLSPRVQRTVAAAWWLCRRAERNDRSLRAWLDTVASGSAFRIEGLDEVRCPTLVVWGEQDTVSPPARGVALANGIRDAREIVYPRVGHFPHLERRERFATDVLNFLES